AGLFLPPAKRSAPAPPQALAVPPRVAGATLILCSANASAILNSVLARLSASKATKTTAASPSLFPAAEQKNSWNATLSFSKSETRLLLLYLGSLRLGCVSSASRGTFSPAPQSLNAFPAPFAAAGFDRSARVASSPLFRCKNIDQLLSDSENAEIRLKKSLGWLSLTSLGMGAGIGSGIFTVVGTAIAGQKLQVSSILNAPLLQYLITHSTSFGRPGAGPAIAISFILVAVVCGFASVCYAELAAMIPIAGSAYTYTYATMGELIAWIIGWDLILEYAVSNMAVSVGF